MNTILNTRQVSEILGIHINTVYKYIHSGALKAFKLGGANSVKHWRIREKDLESFLQGAESEHGESVEYNSKPDQVAGSAPTSE